MSKHSWTFEKQSRLRPSGINLAEPNFTRESRNIVRLFEREFDQNVIDARSDDPGDAGKKRRAHIRVKIVDRSSGLDVALLREIFAPLESHLVAAGHPSETRNWLDPRVLVLEEFQTVGLTGVVDDSYADGENQRWTNFWFGEGKRSKGGASLGRQGQGKITYHIVSGARAVLALTRRENEDCDYVFSKCIVQRTHQVGDDHYTHNGYWPRIDSSGGGQPLPETDSQLVKRIKEGFGLARTNEYGTSWVIPFVPDNFTPEALLREFVGDFFFSVLSEDLTAEIGDTEVNSGTLHRIIQSLNIEEPSQEFFNFVIDGITCPPQSFVTANAGWEKGDRMQEESFSPTDLSRLRESFAAGKVVSVRLPITVFPKTGSSSVPHVEVHLCAGEQIPRVEEIYVRSGLVIADERHLREQTRSAFGMVLAREMAIVEFLGYCEVASHLQWNAREKEANERYTQVADTLSSVRKSLPKLYRLFAGSSEDVVEDALEDLLSLPTSGSRQKPPSRRKPPIKPTPRLPSPEIYVHSEKPGQWQLLPGRDATKSKYPMEIRFRFAYDRLEGTGNPWNRWHPFDFDLSNEEHEPKVIKNAKIVTRDGQDLVVRLQSEDFRVTIGGFSKDQPLLIREVENVA